MKLRSGDYDHLIKKNTGHGRAFSAHKQVLKALGDPQNQTAFDQAVAKWEKRWITVHERNSAAAQFDRQHEQAYHLAGEDFAVVFATAAGDMAADAEAVVASRRFGRVDQPDMAAAAAAAAAPPRRRR